MTANSDNYAALCRKVSVLTGKIIQLRNSLALCYTGFRVMNLHGEALDAARVADEICDGGASSAVFALTENGDLIIVDRVNGVIQNAPDYYNIESR